VWDDVGDRLKLIDVQMPFDIYSEDESLAVLQTIAKDYDFFEFYLRFGRDHAVEMCGGANMAYRICGGSHSKNAKFLCLRYRH
jgi:hypothetical protein